MILNAYSVLDLALALLRLGLALLVVGQGTAVWWGVGCSFPPEARKAHEDRCHLLFSVALLLVGVNLLSWPSLYLLLHSYVTEWPEVMCIYGVTRIGTDSVGLARFLPQLLGFLQLAKPALLFTSGAALVLYQVNRRTQTGPLLRRVLTLLVLLGVLAAADALAELAYLLIPKREEYPTQGCCTVAFDDPTHGAWLAPDPVLGLSDRPLLSAAFGVVTAAMLLGLFRSVAQGRRAAIPAVTPLLLGAGVSLVVGTPFLVEVASPLLLRLPYHHCPYDLFPRYPEALLAVGLFLGGAFSIGWAWLAVHWGDCPESRPFLPGVVRAILLAALFCYGGSGVLIAVSLALAGA